MNKFTTTSFNRCKREGRKISMLTAYDYSMAKLLDAAGVDCILVGDSLGMVMLGYENTLQVTMDDMVHHTKAVARGAKNAFIVADMPFLSYHMGPQEALKNAGRLIQEGCAQGVKLEGGAEVVDQVKALVRAQIPVMGHLGLTPQSVHAFGGFKVQGRDSEQAKKIIEDAKRLQEVGAFAIVLECIPEGLADLITDNLDIPTIGIGAGKGCDGQVLVIQDMLGMFPDFTPKFVKTYADIGSQIQSAVKEYCQQVREGSFPEKQHGFSIEASILEKLY
ncbi:3-methyl-2-oxobutanoate hydroxymethyltransferase [Alkaliphilus crotonatoxidans]